MMDIKISAVDGFPNEYFPKYETSGSAGFDIRAFNKEDENRYIEPGQTLLVGTGLYFAIPKGFALYIFARSGLALRNGIRPGNCVGVVDSDYRGELKIILHNDSLSDSRAFVINNGDRIAQGIILPTPQYEFNTITLDEFNKLSTERGSGGFGSTGVN